MPYRIVTVPAGMRADAYQVGHSRGWEAANYADAYGRESGEESPVTPDHYADTIGSYATGYRDGWEAFGEEPGEE